MNAASLNALLSRILGVRKHIFPGKEELGELVSMGS